MRLRLRYRCRYLRLHPGAALVVEVVESHRRQPLAWEAAVEAVLMRRLVVVKVEVEGARYLLRAEVGLVDWMRVAMVEERVGRLTPLVEVVEECQLERLRVRHCRVEEGEAGHLMIVVGEVVARQLHYFVQAGAAVPRAISSLRREVAPRTVSAVLAVMQRASCPEAPSAGVEAVEERHLRLGSLLCSLPALEEARYAPVCRHLQWAVALETFSAGSRVSRDLEKDWAGVAPQAVHLAPPFSTEVVREEDLSCSCPNYPCSAD